MKEGAMEGRTATQKRVKMSKAMSVMDTRALTGHKR